MSSLTEYLDKKYYGDFQNRWDDTIFRDVILSNMKDHYTCLDYGCGRGNVDQMNFLGHAQFIAGVDPEPEAFDNPYLNEAKILNLQDNHIDYPDESFDLVFSDNVMEHVQNPGIVLAEINRILKPGGLLLFKTPNKHHYMPLIARITPTWFHKYYNKKRGRDTIDTFPTHYSLNTKKDIIQHADENKFSLMNLKLIEGRPEYLRLTFPTYLFGLAYERLVNSTPKLDKFRCVIVATLMKPHTPD